MYKNFILVSTMIPLRKLAELPSSVKFRKAANLVRGMERRLITSGKLAPEEAEYLGKLTELLAEDEGFTGEAAQTLRKARAGFVDTDNEIHRTLNTVYQILLARTGRYQADWDFYESGAALDPSKRRIFSGMQVYFEDIRSPYNVGSMFRAAESFGTEKVWLSPLCADPRHKRALRTAMGCIDVLPWERFPCDPFAAETSALPFSTGPVFALETGGTPLENFPFPSRGILIAGSEELGVSPRALAAADASLGRVSIPVYGAKGSLNVSVAFGIVMQAWAAAQVKG